jgi:site-specific recombinase XerD
VTEIREFAKNMQAEKCANATINRHLATLKRMYNLAMQAEKLTRRPYIPMLKESNARRGFMGDLGQFAVMARLPVVLAVAAETAYTYGWRKEELFTLQRA